MEYSSFPVLVVDDDLKADTAAGRAARAVIGELKEHGLSVIEAATYDDGEMVLRSNPGIGCLMLEWRCSDGSDDCDSRALDIMGLARSRGRALPIFVVTNRVLLSELPYDALRGVTGYMWKLEDTPHFIAGRVAYAVHAYVDELLPPFFGRLVEFAEHHEYSWHTPGHTGGTAFLKTPVGQSFHNFFGENMLRSDLSISVTELGSLLDHSGVVGAAEDYAARVFGADFTMFVTNGTSTSNKIVLHGCVTQGDAVLIDRNCHKSVQHGLSMTGSIPVYLRPLRNGYGIIGPIALDQLQPAAIDAAIEATPLRRYMNDGTPVYAVATNSTYDGLCYDVEAVDHVLGERVDRIHFDEAWFAYARFNPLYAGRYGMYREPGDASGPTVLTTQSTHKLLAALSQASMIHVRQGRKPIDRDRFNEAFMMHASTSPQYAIIASNDVSTAMMDGASGLSLTQESIQEAIAFRKTMVRVGHEITKRDEAGPRGSWWFGVWQPDTVVDPVSGERCDFSTVSDEVLGREPWCWTLAPGADWHGFGDLAEGYCMLDPIKVTLLTPGIDSQGTAAPWGIPAELVSRFLGTRGIVVEKTGDYTLLFLFSIGITRGKWGTLVDALFDFKSLYDREAPLREVFPDLVRAHGERYRALTLPMLGDEMHAYLLQTELPRKLELAYETLPEPVMPPDVAYENLVRGKVEMSPLGQMAGRTSAVMVVPYPPGIPILMPGERVDSAIVEYLEALQEFDRRFPGFSHHVLGVALDDGSAPHTGYRVSCVLDDATTVAGGSAAARRSEMGFAD
jgi:arginine/lysine/ornithine decarboxylase